MALLGYLVFVTVGVIAFLIVCSDQLVLKPLKQWERVTLFIDILEHGWRHGRTLEQVVLSLPADEEVLPNKFRQALTTKLVNDGMRLGEALADLDCYIPKQIGEMIRTGEEIGAIDKVLPACRIVLNDGQSLNEALPSYIMYLFHIPLVLLFALLSLVLVPRFKSMGIKLPDHGLWFALLMLVGVSIALYWLRNYASMTARHRWYSFLPWGHKRLLRNFSAMLAVLLDNGVPEAVAVLMAAQSTTNPQLKRKAAVVVAELEQGVELTQALAHLDRNRELQWRLQNAQHHKQTFSKALAGWHQTLDACAYRQEQAIAHVITTALVIGSSILVAIMSWDLFNAMNLLVQEALLW